MSKLDNESTVESFLNNVHKIITDKNFSIPRNFYLIQDRRNYSPNNKYTNKSTLIDLGYRVEDVVNEIMLLTTAHYKETIIDDKAGKKKPFYCFIKEIEGRQVYIKIKISEDKDKQVFCVSFHFAEYNVDDSQFPYLKK